MKLSKRDIAEAFGMYYDGLEYDEHGEQRHVFRFKDHSRVIDVEWWFEDIDEAWEEANNEFLKPLEKILFDNL